MSCVTDKDLGLSVENSRSETRTTGSDGQSCRRCGEPIRGRRRNGYCSDRCRMRDRRERERMRVGDLMRQLANNLDALRDELVGQAEAES